MSDGLASGSANSQQVHDSQTNAYEQTGSHIDQGFEDDEIENQVEQAPLPEEFEELPLPEDEYFARRRRNGRYLCKFQCRDDTERPCMEPHKEFDNLSTLR
jgi:hypothetical protein